MKHMLKKVFLTVMICFVWQTHGHADTQWIGGAQLWDAGESAHVVPDDGEIYFVSTVVDIWDEDTIVRGILEIRSGGDLTAYDFSQITIDGGSVKVEGTLGCSGSPGIDILDGGSLTILSGFAGGSGIIIELINGTLTKVDGTLFLGGSNLYLRNKSKVSLAGTLTEIDNASVRLWDSTMYVYDTLQNGRYLNFRSGRIYLYSGGELMVLGGKLDNIWYNATYNGRVDVLSGASIYNYYGQAEAGPGIVNLYPGGTFDNVRGTHPGSFNLSTGANFYDRAEVILDRDLEVDCTWTITEKAVIRGRGNEIRLGEYGAIVIEGATASLLLDDVIVSGVGGNKIRGTDTNSTLSVGDVIWIQDSNSSYATGNIFINGEWIIAGDGTTFEYTTNQSSTIDSNGSVKCLGTTFEYNTDNANRINMVDESSVIHLDQGALLATQALTLANGTLVTTGSSSFVGTDTLDLKNVANVHSSGATIKIGDVVM